MKKILLILISFMLLSACAQSVALLGPAITIGKTGNVMQAGFSYGGNLAIKQTTGKTAIEHVSFYVEEKKTSNKENRARKKINNEMISYLKSHIKIMRLKLPSRNKL